MFEVQYEISPINLLFVYDCLLPLSNYKLTLTLSLA
jgi:hypothetical protein